MNKEEFLKLCSDCWDAGSPIQAFHIQRAKAPYLPDPFLTTIKCLHCHESHETFRDLAVDNSGTCMYYECGGEKRLAYVGHVFVAGFDDVYRRKILHQRAWQSDQNITISGFGSDELHPGDWFVWCASDWMGELKDALSLHGCFWFGEKFRDEEFQKIFTKVLT